MPLAESLGDYDDRAARVDFLTDPPPSMHHVRMNQRALRSSCFAALVTSWVAPAWAGPIEDLKPGEWYEVPSSHMKDVDPCPMRNCSYSAVEGQGAVMDDWSGGAYDTVRDRLIVWGGGHGGYAGNEIYVFDLNQLKWSRITEPSDPPGKDVPYAPDGSPGTPTITCNTFRPSTLSAASAARGFTSPVRRAPTTPIATASPPSSG